ncbi:hypothetical protein E2C01_062427 [Portunus trituberculatus]|uniref:Uncharacterized protein n=1 Tax=Portunus trituberculatus TaxID=210409 RepID=A0A5B7HEN3_PORTR|nr:hypothetical protein [Portunus trituberculatus]
MNTAHQHTPCGPWGDALRSLGYLT